MPSVQCSACQKRLKAPDALIGKLVKCPGCGQRIRIAASEPVTQQPVASNATVRRPVEPAPTSSLADLLDEEEAYARTRPAPPKPVVTDRESYDHEPNPYRSPPSSSRRRREPRNDASDDDVPADVLKSIKYGAVAAVVTGTITLAVALVAINAGRSLHGYRAEFAFVDVVLAYSLAFGIYRKSRVAATLMFLYYLAAKIYTVSLTHSIVGGGVSIGFLIAYFRAMMATFKYRKIVGEQQE